ncbi:hypothetical protein FB45DRAFT_911342 [Roridomyces roridus]|uniref:BTB domain-containing protein n=1 Tax=Roridomyces roridus TaxID=1738132 RepID=A0AAD7FRS5_9AGAR|nr:hypothetical protein FB45DRAFT_911342 [Roridomyces roridus]
MPSSAGISFFPSLHHDHSLMSDHPAKRARAATNPDPTYLRSKIWYTDGSVILQAEQTQFRVHSSVLSLHSTVFKDMFEVVCGDGPFDTRVDGCPVVPLFEDTAQDVEIVLEILYDHKFYRTQQKSFAQVAAMWRLGQKYAFDELRDEALRRLQYTFPCALADFHSRYFSDGATVATIPDTYIITYPGLVFDAINLARATGLVSILPAAFFMACSASLEHRSIQQNILHGLPGASGALIHLSSADKALCILATTDLVEKQFNGPYSWLHSCAHHCHGNPSCYRLRNVVRDALGVPIPRMIALDPHMSGEEHAEQFCLNCRTISQTVFRNRQSMLWEQLPAVFGLPPWKELKGQMLQFVGSSCVLHESWGRR